MQYISVKPGLCDPHSQDLRTVCGETSFQREETSP